jgi:hypothetical protein
LVQTHNANQTAKGVIMYLSDFDDMYPMGSGNCWWQPIDGGWVEDTRPYIKNLPVLRDPSDPLSRSGWLGWYAGSGIVAISMTANGYMNWDNAAGAWNLFGVMGLNQSRGQTTRCGDGWMGRGITNGSSVGKASDTIMFSERYGSITVYGPGSFFTGVNWWDGVGQGGLIPDGSRAVAPYTGWNWDGKALTFNKNIQFGGVTPAYSEKISVFVMTDGHAAALDPRSTNPTGDANNDKDTNKWNAYRQ